MRDIGHIQVNGISLYRQHGGVRPKGLFPYYATLNLSELYVRVKNVNLEK